MAKEIQRNSSADPRCRQEAIGGQAMLVGGCVRDNADRARRGYRLRGLRPYAGTAACALAANSAEWMKAARDTAFTLRDAGIGWPCRVKATDRPKASDLTMTANPTLSFEQAAAEAGFTVNAILQDALTGNRRSVRRRWICGGAFCARDAGRKLCDDPLRVLQGCSSLQGFICHRMTKRLPRMRTMKRMI